MRPFQTVAQLLLIAFIANSALAFRFPGFRTKPKTETNQYQYGYPPGYYGNGYGQPATSGSKSSGLMGMAGGIGLETAGSFAANKLFSSGSSSSPPSSPPPGVAPGTPGSTVAPPSTPGNTVPPGTPGNTVAPPVSNSVPPSSREFDADSRLVHAILLTRDILNAVARSDVASPRTSTSSTPQKRMSRDLTELSDRDLVLLSALSRRAIAKLDQADRRR
ncbi:hypothetical protein BGW80DRAFT_1455506 [Lactifluus volemus]|nr:hypothetical protein BGW80DRAFT_1455506 [Lactifluus volemus]